MAISLVGTSDLPEGADLTTHTITLPDNILEDDLIVIWPATQDSSSAGAPTTPSGYNIRWTLGAASAFRPLITNFWKFSAGSDSLATVDIVYGSNFDCGIICGVFRGVDTANPWDTTQTGPTDGGANPDPATITTVTDGAWVLVTAFGNAPSGSTSSPTISSGYTTGITQVPDLKAGLFIYKEVATAGADNPGAWTWTPIDNHTTVTDALRPATGLTATAERAVATGVARGASAVLALAATAERAVATAVARQVDMPSSAIAERADAVAVAKPPFVVAPPPQGPQFPQATLGLRVELAFGADDQSTLDWEWTDVTDRLLVESAMTPRSGRADESSDTQPSTVSLVLDNGDGALTPDLASSPYWPNVKRGAPLRVWVEGRESALDLPGIAGAFASTPDDPDFDFAGDFDLRIRIQPDQWANPGGPATDRQTLLSKAVGFFTEFSWDLQLNRDGRPRLVHSLTGDTQSFLEEPESRVASLRPAWVGLTYDADNGAAGRTITYYSFDGEGAPPGDITDWQLLGDGTAGSVGGVFTGSADIQIGTFAGLPSFRGRVLGAEIRDGINGTVVANPDFTAQTPGTAAFFDGVGKLWTVNGAARIATERVRFVGTIDEVSPTWPFGDNNPTLSGEPSESRVEITASGLLRRLSQGAKPLRSAVFRAISTDVDVLAYWPCEEPDGAAQLASSVPGGDPIVIASGVETGSEDSLPSSGSLPAIPSGEVGSWAAPVPAPAFAQLGWTVDFVFRIPTPETEPTRTPLITIDTLGGAAKWQFSISSTQVNLTVLDGGAATLASQTNAILSTTLDSWVHARIEVEDFGGGTVDFRFDLFPVGEGDPSFGVGSFSGDVGRVTNISNIATGPPDEMAFGHITVNFNLQSDWLDQPLSSWVGESAANRFARLCTEEAIPVEIIGDPDLFAPLGDLTLSEPMGPQQQKTLLELLGECAATDLGVILSRRRAPGLIYRTRKSLEAQPVRLALNAANNEITAPINPRLDDQRLRNDITVATAGGSSARATDPASIAAEGLYEEEIEIIGVGGAAIPTSILLSQPGLADAVDDQNLQQATWRLLLGTWGGMRYPAVAADLSIAPQLIEPWHNVELGDRITVTGLPAQHPAATVELLVEAIEEALGHTFWIPRLTCSPGGPWLIGVLDG